MGKVLAFNRLKIGEIVKIETANSGNFRCEVLSHEGNNIYKLRILEGDKRGKFIYFEMIEMEDDRTNEQ